MHASLPLYIKDTVAACVHQFSLRKNASRHSALFRRCALRTYASSHTIQGIHSAGASRQVVRMRCDGRTCSCPCDRPRPPCAGLHQRIAGRGRQAAALPVRRLGSMQARAEASGGSGGDKPFKASCPLFACPWLLPSPILHMHGCVLLYRTNRNGRASAKSAAGPVFTSPCVLHSLTCRKTTSLGIPVRT